MSFNFNGTQANVTISGNVSTPLPSASQTHLVITGTGSGGSQTIRTPAAGKTFYVFAMEILGAGGIYLYDAPTGAVVTARADTAASGTAWGGANAFISSPIPLGAFTNANPCKVLATNAVTYCVFGIEV